MSILNKAINLVLSEEATFVVINNGEIVHSDSGIGVSCIMRLIKTNAMILNEAIVVDKVIGKAASMLLIKYGVKEVYGLLMSDSAIIQFKKYDVTYDCHRLTDNILNRTKDGLCPLEDVVYSEEDLEVAENKIKLRINQLMKDK